MICNNCFSQIPDGETICPHCKKRVAKKRFQINIPEEKLNEEFLNKADASFPSPEVKTEPPKETTEQKAEPAKSPEKEPQKPAEKPAAVPSVQKAENQTVQSAKKAASVQRGEAPLPPVKKTPAMPKANPAREKKERTARAAVLSICSLCAAVMIALTFVSKYTDVFKTSSDAVKTVALSGFTHSEKSSFEDYAGYFSAFLESGFNRDEIRQEDLLEMMKPQSFDGLYAAFFKEASSVTDVADPAERFKTENGYSYCKIKAANIKKIMQSLGQQVVNCANGKDYYYYDGYYYFASSSKGSSKQNAYSTEVTSSKRTEDGNFYAQCIFTDKDGMKKTVYCIVSLEKSEEGNRWTLLELSSSPLFSEEGVKIEEEKNEALSYSLERKKIQAKTKKGILFANYIIEYPVFSAEEDDEDGKRAAATLNTLYNNLISKYEAKAKKAAGLYKRYLKLGGKKKDLPAYAYVSLKVTYNKNDYISLLEETNEYLPDFSRFEEKKKNAEENGETVMPPVLLPTTTFEGYTLDIKSGEFLKKDSVLGKDYYSVQQKIFEIYLKNNNLLSEDFSELPSDDENIGQLINSSAWCIGENGVLFSYVDPKGYNDSLVLPFSDIDNAEIKF